MGFNFPASPAIGDLYPLTPTSGIPQYTWDGVSWVMKGGTGGPVCYIGDTPPANAPDGAFFWESDTGTLFIKYNDGDSSQWVQASPNAADYAAILAQAGAILRPRNRIVNAAMQHGQQNGFTAGTVANYYMADQWMLGFNLSGGAVSAALVQSTTPNGSQNRLRITVTTALATLTANDFVIFTQNLEGSRVADFRWGTSAARQVILRFGFKGPAGVYSANLTMSPTALRSYIANFTITAAQANLDTEQVFIIPGDIAGAWPTGNVAGIGLRICFATGSATQGVLGWQAANILGTSATSNGLAVAGNVFELFDVGLYLDANNGVPPKWEMPDLPSELALCKRYWEKQNGFVASGQCYSATGVQANYRYVEKRVGPTMSVSSLTGINASNAGTSSIAVTAVAGLQLVSGTSAVGLLTTSGMVAGNATMISASAAGYFIFDARM